jgi:nucleotide-binding universal stress UspA family protein
MFKSIIWATDGSETAETALPYVRELASENHAKLTLLHCDELLVGRSAGHDQFIGDEYVRDLVRRRVRELRDEGIDATARFTSGIGCDAAQQVSEAVDELGADLVVIGTRGRNPLGQLFLGSVTQRLLELGPCPVFVVPTMTPAGATTGRTAAAATA